MQYYMPTRIIEDTDTVKKNAELLASYGQHAFIVTGKSSAKINGAYQDVVDALEANGVTHTLFDQVEENPSVETIEAGAAAGAECDYIITIGGGSPIDAAKGMAVLIANPEHDTYDMLFGQTGSKHLTVVAIPTTGGTGTESTPYAIYTDHKVKTKRNFSQKVFPIISLLDVKYYMFMPKNVRVSTCVDALTHLVEGYMNTNATKYSDYNALEGIRLWGQVKDALLREDVTEEEMTAFMNASTIAGFVISQTGTSIPHGMGYHLTYYHGMAHGQANGILMAGYLSVCQNKDKVKQILDLLGFKDLETFGGYMKSLFGPLCLTEDDLNTYADYIMSNARKLKNHPDPITRDDVMNIYKKAMA